jgi:hypothetical protein
MQQGKPCRFIPAPSPHPTMKRFLFAAAVLLLAAPAQAQAFFPYTAGAQFCRFRASGVTYDDAIRAAIAGNLDTRRQATYVNRQGGRTTTDVIEFAHYVARTCPEYLRK